MREFDLEILTPSKKAFSGKVVSVTIPGTLGSFQILYNHAPLISTFEIGLLKFILPDNTPQYFATSGGTVEAANNKVLVLADTIEAAEDIDEERAIRAKERAQKRLLDKTQDTDLERAEAALKRAVNRLNIIEKYVRGLV
jgi:F-type H+-transporting ATPase subunit epsilon